MGVLVSTISSTKDNLCRYSDSTSRSSSCRRTSHFQNERCLRILIVAVFLKQRTGDHLDIYGSEDKIHKLWYVHILEYYVAIKNNEV